MENAIKEWTEGTYHNVHFSEDTSAERYASKNIHIHILNCNINGSYVHHMKTWQTLEKKSPMWLEQLQKELFKKISYD